MVKIQSRLQDMYNHFGLSWDDVPDAKNFVTPLNIMWLLSNLEDYLSNLMTEVVDKSSSITLQPKDSSSSSDRHRSLTSQRTMMQVCQSRVFDKSGETRIDSAKDILAETNEPLTPDQIREKLNMFLATQNAGCSSMTDFEKK